MSDFSNELHTQIQYSLIEKLSESERRYRELVDSLREIVFKCDRLGNLNFLNRAWTNTLGYGITDAIGSALGNFIDLDDRHLWEKTLEKLQTGVEVCQVLRFYHQTGVIVWLELSAQPQSETEFSGSLINISDVYDELRLRKHAEALLKQTNEELETRVEQRNIELIQANHDLKVILEKLKYTQAQLVQTEKMSSLGQLVAGIAHEINNPVNFIYANLTHASEYTKVLLKILQLYQQTYPVPSLDIQKAIVTWDLDFIQKDLGKLLESMQVGSDRIREIVLSLRNFSRLDEAEIKNVDIHTGINHTITFLRHRFQNESKTQVIQVIKNYGVIPQVKCYPAQINQVFMNIINNAIYALNEAIANPSISQNPESQPFVPTIWIITEIIHKNWLNIRIKNNGLGIHELIISKIFDPFFTTKPVGKGSGLGLFISYQIVAEMHQGKLICNSKTSQETEFCIQIPI
ncbi:MAG: PAS domain-containing sensor histidine kinase [Nostoc sp. NMS7]|uniref:PAS domain-containing sensor histidine kinase n=1 Tax=Nostoc sp. NMS7 TaxID=2815391 RepID=UPI0025D7E7FF|nr:ATP-binding protein [Nostoc sp. NMS7]MBN3946502.1 PAS domain-containing sensor histidine kinase [Nostoc sp. NMS7]